MDSYVYLNWEALSLLINLDSNLSQIDINKSFWIVPQLRPNIKEREEEKTAREI